MRRTRKAFVANRPIWACIVMGLLLAGCGGEPPGTPTAVPAPMTTQTSAPVESIDDADAITLPPELIPPDGRQVAVLDLSVDCGDTLAVPQVKLNEASIFSSFAPQVFGRSGPWTIELLVNGDRIRSIGTLDPRIIHVAQPGGGEPEVLHMLCEGTISWYPVVPLHDGFTPLNIDRIDIYDQDRNLVFTSAVPFPINQ